MSAKAVLGFCFKALLLQLTLAQCIFLGGDNMHADIIQSLAHPYNGFENNFAYGNSFGPAESLGAGYYSLGVGYDSSAMGGLPISSNVPGLLITSENTFQGSLTVFGEMPFLSLIAIEGVVPSAGKAGVNYVCGNGVAGISNSGLNSDYAGNGLDGFGPAVFGADAGLLDDRYGFRNYGNPCGVYQ